MSEKGITGAGIGIMVIRNNQVLLGLRHSDPTKADSELHGEGTWTMPGGKIRFGETFEEATARELTEETSLIGHRFTVMCVNNDKITDAHFITVGILCTEFSGEVKTMEPEEIVEWRWFDINNLPNKIFFPSEKMISNYKTNQFYIQN